MYKIRLAPLCGVTDHIYRSICYGLGCELAYTEMISAMGYLCAPDHTATRQLMIRGVHEPRLIIQLFGKSPDVISEAAKRIENLGIYDGIDLNMGCPARKVASSGEGSGLLRTPDLACQIMKETVKAVSIPVSVKMRIGWDREHINVLEMAKMAEDSGISEITVHGRTREQQYSGKADWDIIEEVSRRISIPIIGNGDIFSAEEAVLRLNHTGVAGIMIGRGALGNPWIFRDIQYRMNQRTPPEISLNERKNMILFHYQEMLRFHPEHIAVREMRKYIGWYIHGLRDAARIRSEINTVQESGTVLSILAAYFDRIEEMPH